MTTTIPLLGVGRLLRHTDDLRMAQTDAARYVLEVILRLAKIRHPDDLGDLDPVDLITQAERLTYRASNTHILQLYLFPMPWQIEVPPDWLAWITTVTSQWKRGREPLVNATEAMIEEVLGKIPAAPSQMQIERKETVPDHWPYFYAYHIAVKRSDG